MSFLLAFEVKSWCPVHIKPAAVATAARAWNPEAERVVGGGAKTEAQQRREKQERTEVCREILIITYGSITVIFN